MLTGMRTTNTPKKLGRGKKLELEALAQMTQKHCLRDNNFVHKKSQKRPTNPEMTSPKHSAGNKLAHSQLHQSLHCSFVYRLS